MLQIAAGNIIAYLSYCIAINNELIILSDFHKSSLAINGISACLSLGNEPVRILEEDVYKRQVVYIRSAQQAA